MKAYTKNEILLPAIPNYQDYIYAALLYLGSNKEASIRKCDSEIGEVGTTRLSEYRTMVRRICPHHTLFTTSNVYEACIYEGKDVNDVVRRIAEAIEVTGLCCK